MIKLFTLVLSLTIMLLTSCTGTPKSSQPVIVIRSFRGDFSLGGFYAVHPDGSPAKGFPRSLLGDEPQWSKDGKWVVFSTYNRLFALNTSQIIFMRSSGRDRIALTDKEGDSRSPAWSPDGRSIAYEACGKIYVVDVSCFIEGGSIRECPILPRQIASGYDPDWEPTGERILYNTYESGSYNYSIQMVDSDGSGTAHTITTPGLEGCGEPKWSPDGSEIVFGCWDGIMYRILEDGTLLTSYVDLDISGRDPKWSPDGKRIFFVSVMADDLAKPVNMEGSVVSSALFSMKPDGTDVVRITSRNDEHIDWFSIQPK